MVSRAGIGRAADREVVAELNDHVAGGAVDRSGDAGNAGIGQRLIEDGDEIAIASDLGVAQAGIGKRGLIDGDQRGRPAARGDVERDRVVSGGEVDGSGLDRRCIAAVRAIAVDGDGLVEDAELGAAVAVEADVRDVDADRADRKLVVGVARSATKRSSSDEVGVGASAQPVGAGEGGRSRQPTSTEPSSELDRLLDLATCRRSRRSPWSAAS